MKIIFDFVKQNQRGRAISTALIYNLYSNDNGQFLMFDIDCMVETIPVAEINHVYIESKRHMIKSVHGERVAQERMKNVIRDLNELTEECNEIAIKVLKSDGATEIKIRKVL